MFDGLNDDDDAFFTPVSSSKLASLFGVSVTQVNSSPANTSLTYTAPKQPANKSDESAKKFSKSNHQSSVIVFKEVYAFKLVEKNYLNQGKCGLALIGNDTVQIYQLLLYKQKNDIISSTKISETFQFIIQKDSYSSYCDDQKQNWTIHFNSELELNEFSTTLESRGGKILKIKNESDTNEVSNSTNLKSTVTKDINKESPKQIDSDNHSDTSSSNVKANILSRMAKMGQKMLPNTSISDGTDSETEREKAMHSKNRKIKRGTATSPILGINSSPEVAKQPVNLIPSQNNAVQASSYLQPIPQQYAMINGQPIPISSSQIGSTYHSVLPVENISSPVTYTQLIPPSFDQLQMYFTENRTHNSEVRMNILRLTNKMEEVLEKVHKMDTNFEKGTTTNDSEHIILKEENEKLKSSIEKLKNEIKISKEYEEQKNKLLEKEQNLVKENDELKKEIKQFLTNENEYKQKINELELKIKDKETPTGNTEADGDKSTEKRNEKLEVSIKKTMNSLYFEVTNQIQDDETIQGKDVKKILAQKIRDNTYSIISAVSDLNLSK